MPSQAKITFSDGDGHCPPYRSLPIHSISTERLAMGRQQQHQTKTTNSQAATSPALQKSAVDSISEFQELFGSRAASRQFRSQQPDAQSLASSLSGKLGMPTIQAKPSFRGLSSELTAKDSQIQSPRQNQTGLPDNLRAGIENLSGISMADVKVHFNSTKPSELQALAYTQGTDIYLGSGQEKHLAHEGWHVVQQKQGRVQPTMQAKGKPMNSDRALEKEADIMGAKALQTAPTDRLTTTIENPPSSLALPQQTSQFSTSNMPVQFITDTDEDKNALYNAIYELREKEGLTFAMKTGKKVHIELYKNVERYLKNNKKISNEEWASMSINQVAQEYVAIRKADELINQTPRLSRMLTNRSTLTHSASISNLLTTHPEVFSRLHGNAEAVRILNRAVEAAAETQKDAEKANSKKKKSPENSVLTTEQENISKAVLNQITAEPKDQLQTGTKLSPYQTELTTHRNNRNNKKSLEKSRKAYVNELYQQAGGANIELRDLTEYLVGRISELKSKSKSQIIESEPESRDGLKNPKRAMDKIIEYEKDETGSPKKDASSLVDIAGSRILFNSVDDLFTALEQIPSYISNYNQKNSGGAKSTNIKIVKIKNRFQPRLRSGYADILMNLKMSNGHIVEFRLELKQFIEVAHMEHDLYEVVRNIEFNTNKQKSPATNPEKTTVIDNINTEIKKKYDEALKQALKNT